MSTVGVVDRVTQTVELPPKRQTRRHPIEWKRTIVALTFEPGASVARVARENGINANQVWAWQRSSGRRAALLRLDTSHTVGNARRVVRGQTPSQVPQVDLGIENRKLFPNGSSKCWYADRSRWRGAYCSSTSKSVRPESDG
ncbi:hypothetical protein DIE18_12650 [Burkholderia sp. Bp9125]|nr:hypothetical protein DIE18_12650 [Burkholderia sp. Bp9125]